MMFHKHSIKTGFRFTTASGISADVRVNADALNAHVSALILSWLFDIRCENHKLFHTKFKKIKFGVKLSLTEKG